MVFFSGGSSIPGSGVFELEVIAKIALVFFPNRFGRGFKAIVVNPFAVEPAVVADLQILATGNAGGGPMHLHFFVQLGSAKKTNPHDPKIVYVNAASAQQTPEKHVKFCARGPRGCWRFDNGGH
jgi:hypothetical protein